MQIEVIRGDITTLDVGVIVNAANESLRGGGGVDAAIHAAAGPELVAASGPLGPIAAGEAVITPGFRLPAAHVVHTVGPRWSGGTEGEAEALASCYRESLRLAAEVGATSVAFPAISTGVFGYPAAEAADVAVAAIRSAPHAAGRVLLVGFSEADVRVLEAAVGAG